MPDLSKVQIIALIGFLIVLISIPISFSMVKQTQIFSSKASEQKKVSTNSAFTTATKQRPVPSNSPLTDLQKLIQESGGVIETPFPTPTASADIISNSGTNLSFGPTLNFKAVLEGRPADDQSDKMFVGIASGTTALNPTYLLTFTVDIPKDGIFKGLSLAGLNPGSVYTVYLKGTSQIDSASTFTMNPNETNLDDLKGIVLISGDLNEDNVINAADYTIARNLFGITPLSANWNPRADINKDNIINNWDLLYINNNFGKVGASGTWISTPKTTSSIINQNTAPPVGGPANFGDLLLISNSSPSAEATSSTIPSSGYWLYVP